MLPVGNRIFAMSHWLSISVVAVQLVWIAFCFTLGIVGVAQHQRTPDLWIPRVCIAVLAVTLLGNVAFLALYP